MTDRADTSAVLFEAEGRTAFLRRLFQGSGAAIPFAVLVVISVAVVVGPAVAGYDPNHIQPVDRLQGPSSQHLLGTDELGRDLLVRVLSGGQLALGIAVASTAIALITGVIWGGSAALGGKLVDEILMRTGDAAMAIPFLLAALVFVAAFGASLATLVVILGLLHAPFTARIARVGFLSERHSDYYLAAVAYGASRWRLLSSEVLPNVLPTLLVQASLVAASVILTEAALSFVGLGVQPPEASWGTLLQQGYAQIYSSTLYMVVPAIMIFVTIWCLNAFADHLQSVFDPRGAHSQVAAA